MATADLVHYLKQGDDRPAIQLTLPAGLDLTGGSATFRMTDIAGTVVVDDASATVDETGDGDAVQPIISYAWQSADTDAAGTFRAEFAVTFASGKTERYPNNGHVWVEIEETS